MSRKDRDGGERVDSEGGRYEIRIRGSIGPQWADWFDGMQIEPGLSGETVIRGPVKDQSALQGIIARIGDLNLALVSVNRMEEDAE